MKRGVFEWLAAGVIGTAIVAAVAVPLQVESLRREFRGQEMPTIELTAVMDQGLWTDEAVTALTAWRRDFRRGRPVLTVGQTVRLHLASADVVHAFAAPGLGIDRIEVYPGKIVEILVTPREAGVFEYYCTTVCGAPHFAMRGFLEVAPGDAAGAVGAGPFPEQQGAGYWLTPEPAQGAGVVTRGAWLYRRQGCVTCHGVAGAGGTPNLNSMNSTVPELANLAARNFLFTAEDVDAFLGVLTGGRPLETVSEASAVPLFPAVKRQFEATRKLVRNGRQSSRLDPSGPRPPLDMPAWGARLSEADIDAVLAYLLTVNRGDAAAAAGAAGPNLSEGVIP